VSERWLIAWYKAGWYDDPTLPGGRLGYPMYCEVVPAAIRDSIRRLTTLRDTEILVDTDDLMIERQIGSEVLRFVWKEVT